MKTVKEWLHELPEPHRSQALENWDGTNDKKHYMHEAVAAAFFWPTSKEGFKYWEGFFNKMVRIPPARKDGQYSPDITKKSNRELAKIIHDTVCSGEIPNIHTNAIVDILNQYR